MFRHGDWFVLKIVVPRYCVQFATGRRIRLVWSSLKGWNRRQLHWRRSGWLWLCSHPLHAIPDQTSSRVWTSRGTVSINSQSSVAGDRTFDFDNRAKLLILFDRVFLSWKFGWIAKLHSIILTCFKRKMRLGIPLELKGVANGLPVREDFIWTSMSFVNLSWNYHTTV